MNPEIHTRGLPPELPTDIRTWLRNANIGSFSPTHAADNPDEAEKLKVYRSRHDAYLDGVQAEATDYAADHKDMSSARAVSASYFDAKTENRSALPLAEMGLPPLPADISVSVPIAIVLNSKNTEADSSDTEVASGVSLVTIGSDGRNANQYVLQNLSALEAPEVAPEDQGPQWVRPGKSILGQESPAVVPHFDDERSMLTLSFQANHIPTNATIIRAAQNKAELAYEKTGGAPPSRKPQRITNFVGAVAAATGLLLSPSPKDASEWAPASAAEMVHDAGTTEVNGIKQAEQFFDATILNRSRAAFQAYENGDSASLAQQAESYGYHANWVDPEKLSAVKAAQNPDELIRSFDAIFDKEAISIDLNIATTAGDASRFNEQSRDYYRHTPIEDFEDARTTAIAAIDTFNLLDKQGVKKISLHVKIAGSLTEINTSKGDRPAGGYYEPVISPGEIP